MAKNVKHSQHLVATTAICIQFLRGRILQNSQKATSTHLDYTSDTIGISIRPITPGNRAESSAERVVEAEDICSRVHSSALFFPSVEFDWPIPPRFRDTNAAFYLGFVARHFLIDAVAIWTAFSR